MRRALFPILAFVALVVIGCGGGGGSVLNPGVISPTGTPTPHVGPTVIPTPPAPSEVIISGAGYTLKFTLPPVVVGNLATVTAELSATPPPNIPILQSSARAPRAGVGTQVGLVYLTVSSSTGLVFGSTPSFVWTLPSASVIPPGSFAYITFYDGKTWAPSHTLGTSVPSGTTLPFPGSATGLSFAANVQYVYALTINTVVPPTPSPAPIPSTTPSPGPAPTPTPTTAPAYCNQYSSSTSANAVPLNITDDSGLGATLMVYVLSGANYMDNSGAFTQPSPYPLPAACFSTTSGSGVVGKSLKIPQNASGRIFFAYTAATPNPNPSATPPNPFAAAINFNPDYNESPFPWDKIEYTISPGGIIDTTQVDFMGLPVEMSLTSPLPHQAAGSCPAVPAGVVGVTSCGFATIFSQIAGLPASPDSSGVVRGYPSLIITQPFNGKTIDMRAVAPKNGALFTGFQWNLFDLPSFAPTGSTCNAGNTGTDGYLQCVLASYQTTQRIFSSGISGAAGSGDWYCATSDGSANFIFTDVGKAQPITCPATKSASPQLAKNPFMLPITTLTYGIPPAKDQNNVVACQYNNLFSQPYGLSYVDNQLNGNPPVSTGTGNLFSGTDAFALWKALVADLNYGNVLQAGSHPVDAKTSHWNDPMFNNYAQIIHSNFDNNLAYALAYDDAFGWSTALSYATGNSINVRINPVPSAASASGAAENPVPNPTCTTIPPEIGTY